MVAHITKADERAGRARYKANERTNERNVQSYQPTGNRKARRHVQVDYLLIYSLGCVTAKSKE